MLNRPVTKASIRVSFTSLPDVIFFKRQIKDEDGFTSHLRRGRFNVPPQTRPVLRPTSDETSLIVRSKTPPV